MNRYLVVFILIFFVQSAWSNDEDIQKLVNYSTRATKFTRSYPPHEKVYLHMDNRSYFLDETLWYKAYAVDADSNRLTKASEILHIELLSPEGAVIRTQKQRLVDGQCDGYFTLDSALYSGYFEIRAYTKVMLNYDEQNYFSRVFPLFEKPKKLGEFDSIRRTLPRYRTVGALKSEKEREQDRQRVKKEPNYIINFYPEGGSLIKDKESKVAFQIKDSYGEIVNTTCYLWSNQNIIVDSVVSSHLGMGIFQITPESKSNGYYVTIKGDYKNSKFPLPDALKSGYILSADNLSDSLKLKIRVGATEFGSNLGVAVLSRGCTAFSEVITPTEKNPTSRLEVEKSTLREGVNQVVLYNNKGQELASRMVFIQNGSNNDTITISATIQTDSIKPYEQQEILFKLKNGEGEGVETNFSLSIYDSTSHTPTFCKDNIYTNLLLSSEVKGFIPNIDYYFDSKDAKRTANLDLLLQVYGWSRYRWEYLSGAQRMDNKYLLEKNLALYGRAYGQTWHAKIQFIMKPEDVYDVVENRFESIIGRDYVYYLPTKDIQLLFGTYGVNGTNIYNDSLLYYKNNDKGTSLFWNKNKFNKYNLPMSNQGQFSQSFEDFYGEIKILLSSLDPDVNKGKKMYSTHLHSLFVMESEWSPKEKLYDYFEITRPQDKVASYAVMNRVYVSQYAIDKIDVYSKNELCFHPAIKTKYYNQGFYSDIYPAFNRPILDRVHSRGLSSIDGYIENYDINSYKVNSDMISNEVESRIEGDKSNKPIFLDVATENKDFEYYECGPFWSRNRHIAYPTEYLKYYKLPLGTITFISNTTIDTTGMYADRSYFTTPLKHESLDIEDYNLDPSKYTCYLDSTVIHTNAKTIEAFYKKFQDHANYQQYDIQNMNNAPIKTSAGVKPKYVVEHFCRIIKQKAKRDVIMTKSKIESAKTIIQGQEMGAIGTTKEVIRENKYSHYDKIKRAIIFQGLTRMEKEFYSPDYSKTPLPTQGDYRRTLYWNPNVKTDSNGQASVEFYNNSSCTKYNIDAQTVTKNGEIGVLFK